MNCKNCGISSFVKPLSRKNPTGQSDAGWMCQDCIKIIEPELYENLKNDGNLKIINGIFDAIQYTTKKRLENKMIYCLKTEMYPTPELIIEEISCFDKNDFEWKIARVKNGFFVTYFGEPYFKETYFSCDLKSGEHILIKNTNCIFIKDTDIKTFSKVSNIIKTAYTDVIWETFQEMFEQRFEYDKALLESEIVKFID